MAVARSRVPLPPVMHRGAPHWQDLASVISAIERALAELEPGGAPSDRWSKLCVTSQRDTAVLLGDDLTPLDAWGRPGQGALLSWRDLRPSLDANGVCGARSLPAFLCERWTGRAVESSASPSRRTSAEWLRTPGSAVDRPPASLPPGQVAGLWEGIPIHLAAGDKNCEALACGAVEAGRATLSMGSAISMGLVTESGPRPREVPGVVISPAAISGRWSVETGVPSGMSGLDLLDSIVERSVVAPSDPVAPSGRVSSGSPAEAQVWITPYFTPPLDAVQGAEEKARMWSTAAAPHRAAVERGWIRGVLCEIFRLRRILEEVAGAAVTSISVTGGGVDRLDVGPLVADAFGVPVSVRRNPWLGTRGAVACVLRDQGRDSAAFERQGGASGEPRWTFPDPQNAGDWARYMERWMTLRESPAGAGPSDAASTRQSSGANS